MAKALAAFLLVIGALILGVATTVNAYGLTIESWPWLICGSFGSLMVYVIAQALGK